MAATVAADRSWRLEGIKDAEAQLVVWGGMALPSSTPLRSAIAFSVAREGALLRLRAGAMRPLQLAGVHRLPPPVLRLRSPKNPIRAALLGGAIAELVAGERPERVLDAVARAAGAVGRVTGFTASSGGTAVVRARRPGGDSMVMRAARTGSPGDPERHADALAMLGGVGTVIIPRLLGRGEIAGASWSAETVLPGRRPVAASSEIAMQAAGFCAGLPRRDEPPSAFARDLSTVAEWFPELAVRLAELADLVRSELSSFPGVVRHGDLWAGNLMVSGRRLTGVVDWDAWDAAGVPGTDLLHLVATEEAHRTRRSLGAVWLDRPWRGEIYRRWCAEYWRALRVKPGANELDAIGIAWWASHVSTALTRLPELSRDQMWVNRNVEGVLDALA
jgi:hypothetical protein